MEINMTMVIMTAIICTAVVAVCWMSRDKGDKK